jgi:hypothetical protein
MYSDRFQYLILGLLIGGLVDSLITSTQTLVQAVGGVAAFLGGFLLLRGKTK